MKSSDAHQPNRSQPMSVNHAHLPAITQATSAAIGSVISNGIVYPLDLITTKMQTRRIRRIRETKTRPPFTRQSSLASEFSVTSTASSRKRSRDYSTVLTSFQTILHSEPSLRNSLGKFYNGIWIDSIATLINSFAYFYIYTNLNKLKIKYKKETSRKIGWFESTAEEILMGSLTGMVSKFVTCPLNNITVRLQTSSSTANPSVSRSQKLKRFDADFTRTNLLANHDGGRIEGSNRKQRDQRSTNFHLRVPANEASSDEEEDSDSDLEGEALSNLRYLLYTIQSIYKERGYRGFWCGFGNNCILTLNPSLTLYLTKLLNHFIHLRHEDRQSNVHHENSLVVTFLNSALASSLSTMITYPLMLSKTLIQTNHHMHSQPPKTLVYRYRHYGFRSLYTGLQAKLLKVFIGQGITMSIKNRIETIFISLWIFFHHHHLRRRRRHDQKI